MSNRFQVRKGNTAQNDSFTGAIGELSYDTDKKQLRVHDGNVVGGIPLANHQDIDENLLNYLPTPYPKSTPPSGYLAMMGQTISQATYPKLYGLYGATLPDLRAYTIRGLDNGRGIDIDRTILSEQNDEIKAHNHLHGQNQRGGNVAPYGATSDPTISYSVYGGHPSGGGSNSVLYTKTTGGEETRIKNIAFLYIVKAG